MENTPTIPLNEGITLNELLTTGCILDINTMYGNVQDSEEEHGRNKMKDNIGWPVNNFVALGQQLKSIDDKGLVKKRILNRGWGKEPLTEKNTIIITYSGYWEGEPEPFDMKRHEKPLVVDLEDHGLLPGLEIAIKSMLEGELSMFLLKYEVMYGELGMPPRIKPKEDTVFFIKLMKIMTTEKGPIKFSEPTGFAKEHQEVKLLFRSGIHHYNCNQSQVASNIFRKAINILHGVRLADEKEEEIQKELLRKLYINSAICYNKSNKPLKACTCCNELNRLNSLWNNPKALIINARALRMIGAFDDAAKRLKKALQLRPDSVQVKEEFHLLEKTREDGKKYKILPFKQEHISDEFKHVIDELVQEFKRDMNLGPMVLPADLNRLEINYAKEACKKEHVSCTNQDTTYFLDSEEDEDY